MKYKLKQDVPYSTTSSFSIIKKGTILEQNAGTFTDYFYGGCGMFHITTIENNPDWFEKIEEPFISVREKFYYIDTDGVGETSYSPTAPLDEECMAMHNIFPVRLFTREEVQAHADRIKQLNKEFQESKQ